MRQVARLLAAAALAALLSPAGAGTETVDTLLQRQRADLERVRSAYVDTSLSFDANARRATRQRVTQALQATEPMPPPAFFAELMAIAALAGNGHDFVDTGSGWSPTRRLPVRLLWLSDGLVLARSGPAHVEHAGARVRSINGRPVAEVEAVLTRHTGALPAYARHNLLWLLESPEMLHALGLGDDPRQTRWNSSR